MARTPKYRCVSRLPGVTYFKPAGIPMRVLNQVVLSVEELEAIRLKDLRSLEQKEAAVDMKVSRPTFQRVLGRARRKVADALVNGKALRIEGGHYEVAWRDFVCPEGHRWSVSFEELVQDAPRVCPVCGSKVDKAVVAAGRCRRRSGHSAGGMKPATPEGPELTGAGGQHPEGAP